jgi:hypothetical protein
MLNESPSRRLSSVVEQRFRNPLPTERKRQNARQAAREVIEMFGRAYDQARRTVRS